MYQSKKQDVRSVKEHLEEARIRREQEELMKLEVKKQRHQGIKDQCVVSTQGYKEYQIKKQNRLKDQFRSRVDEEKKLIYELEQEAQKLEAKEEALIKELQDT